MIYKTIVKIKKILVFSGLIAVLAQQTLALDDEKAQAYFQARIKHLTETKKNVSPYKLLNLSSHLSSEIYFYFLLSPHVDFPENLQALLTESQNLSLKFEKKWLKNPRVTIQTPLLERALLLAFLGERGESLADNNVSLNVFNILKTNLNIETSDLKNRLIIFLFDFATQSQFMQKTLITYQQENLNSWGNKINLQFKTPLEQGKKLKDLNTFFREKIYRAEVFYKSLNAKLHENLLKFWELKTDVENEINSLYAFWKLYHTLPESSEIAKKALIHSVYLSLQLLVSATHIEGALNKHEGYNYFPRTYLEWTRIQKYILENEIAEKLRDFHALNLEDLKIQFLEIQYETSCALYHPGPVASTIRKLLLLDPWIELRPIDEKWLKR